MAAPPAAAVFHAQRRRVLMAALGAAAHMWGKTAPADFDGWFDRNVDELVDVTAKAQERAAEPGGAYVAEALREQGTPVAAEAAVRPQALAGVASDGRPLDSLLYGSVIRAKAAMKGTDGSVAAQNLAWQAGRDALLLRVQTQVSDASRVSTGLSTFVRPQVGFVRMLVGKSCSRCAVLAGRKYRTPAFQRHPGCDCQMIPELDAADDLTTDPKMYFDSLGAEEQDRIFTKAGAQAIRDGADPSQVVNARRGMTTASSGRMVKAQIYGQHIAATTEGMTRRGLAHKAVRRRHGAFEEIRPAGARYTMAKIPRPMPEAIYEIAADRAEALRLLRIYGYIDP
ncbi:hypothetical protein [Tomitella gaofuii]|uniref:hypothetical protein n=1 Tax=Tomitella gaofuii TaxID=2760083 RepID=UPI0015FD7D3B|nr:hypothetical protein [Tomitella gaofuii]